MKIRLPNILKKISVVIGICVIALISVFSINLKNKVESAAIGEPILILSAGQLNNIANSMASNAKTYKNSYLILSCSIDMSSYPSFKGIGTEDNHFCGTFDGQGYEISNLLCDGYRGGDSGLFGYISASATIQNVVVTSGSITCASGKSAGAIVGSTQGAAKIKNCYNLGCKIQANGTTAYIGGIVGYMNAGTIESCYNKAEVSSTNAAAGGTSVYAGGITAYLASGTISKSCNKGTIRAGHSSQDNDNKPTEAYAGGIAGSCKGDIKNCLNSGVVSAYAKTNLSSKKVNALGDNELDKVSWTDYTMGKVDAYVVMLKNNDFLWDKGSSYCETSIKAYRAGISGAIYDGTISDCIDTTSTNYATSGTPYSGCSITINLNYLLYNFILQLGGTLTSAGVSAFRMDVRIELNLRENWYNCIVGYMGGGQFFSCASNSYPTMKGINIKITTDDYRALDAGPRDAISLDRAWLEENSYDSELNFDIHTKDLGNGFADSPAINLKEVNGGYTISAYDSVKEFDGIWEAVGAQFDLYEIDMEKNGHSGWIKTLTKQSTVSIRTIVEKNRSIWALNGSTPEIKGFYWKYNTDGPSED